MKSKCCKADVIYGYRYERENGKLVPKSTAYCTKCKERIKEASHE